MVPRKLVFKQTGHSWETILETERQQNSAFRNQELQRVKSGVATNSDGLDDTFVPFSKLLNSARLVDYWRYYESFAFCIVTHF